MGKEMTNATAFTLIEVLVVMAIIAILAVLAYPSYTGYIVKARRVEGQVALLDLMQKQERYYAQHNTYLPFSAESSDPEEKRFRWWSGDSPGKSAYEMSGRACGDLSLQRCIELRAEPGTPLVDSSFRDRDCETLSLTNAGEHRATGSHPRCWP